MNKMDLVENIEKSDLKTELENVKEENKKLVKKVSKLEFIKEELDKFINEAEDGMFKLLKKISSFELRDLFPSISKPLLDRVIFKGEIDSEEEIQEDTKEDMTCQSEELTEEEDGGEKGSDGDMGI